MQRRQFLIAGSALLGLSRASWAVYDSNMLKDWSAKIELAMGAYNKRDWKAFYGANWSKAMCEMGTEENFHKMYDASFKTYGQYRSKKFREDRSTLAPPDAILAYDGVFSIKKAPLLVSFLKENGVWKLQQLGVGVVEDV